MPVDANESDAESLKQLPGVDVTTAEALIAARPFASSEAFLAALAAHVGDAQAAAAAGYLAMP